MGTYVTYMVSHLFDLPEMKKYANERLYTFINIHKNKKALQNITVPPILLWHWMN